MALTAGDLASIRDEIGDATPPADQDLTAAYDELGHWILVAVRVLKRRRAAAAAGGGVTQVTVPGAVGVTLQGAQLAALDRQIAALESRYEAETGIDAGGPGVTFGQLTRLTAR